MEQAVLGTAGRILRHPGCLSYSGSISYEPETNLVDWLQMPGNYWSERARHLCMQANAAPGCPSRRRFSSYETQAVTDEGLTDSVGQSEQAMPARPEDNMIVRAMSLLPASCT